jgi:Xaa-Pro aminopeptidase
MTVTDTLVLSDRISAAPTLPFDGGHLDELLDAAGIDILVVTAKHNIQYLLGGYRFFFFDQFDALGIARYLPILLYPKGRPEDAVYIGNAMEGYETQNGRFWCPTVETRSWGTLDAAELAARHIEKLVGRSGKIGIEFAFIPADAMDALRASLPNAEFVEGHLPLERLRAVKTSAELASLREASERVVAAMLATFDSCRPGQTKREVTARLRQEERDRGLEFEYCLITAGRGFNRAPSDQILQPGDILSLDSGGRYDGYIGDLCRMGIVGKPDAELEDLLGWIETIQQQARTPIRAGMTGRAIFDAVRPVLSASPLMANTDFVAHGMGLISHEAPRLTDRGPVTYPAYDADLALPAGMVLSIETTLHHPKRGFIKLEDTLAITDTGFEAYGDNGRGWNTSASA